MIIAHDDGSSCDDAPPTTKEMESDEIVDGAVCSLEKTCAAAANNDALCAADDDDALEGEAEREERGEARGRTATAAADAASSPSAAPGDKEGGDGGVGPADNANDALLSVGTPSVDDDDGGRRSAGSLPTSGPTPMDLTASGDENDEGTANGALSSEAIAPAAASSFAIKRGRGKSGNNGIVVSTEGSLPVEQIRGLVRPREQQRDSVCERHANPSPVGPMPSEPSAPGDGAVGNDERMASALFSLEPTTPGTSSALEEGGGSSGIDVDAQRPREKNNAVVGNRAVDGEQPAKSLTLQPMPMESSMAGDRDNENDEQMGNAPLSSEPIALGTSSALGEGGGTSGIDVDAQHSREQNNVVFGNRAVDGEQSAKPLTLQPMPMDPSTAGDRDSEHDERMANAPLSSEPTAPGTSSAVGEEEDTSSNNFAAQRPREQNDLVIENLAGDGEQSAKPLTLQPMPIDSSTSGYRGNDKDERMGNTSLSSEPTAPGTSSALGEGGDISGKVISVQQPREQNDALVGNLAVDGEQSAKPLTLQPMLIDSSTAGGRDNENDERGANAPLASEPTAPGTSSALGEGRDISSNNFDTQQPREQNDALVGNLAVDGGQSANPPIFKPMPIESSTPGDRDNENDERIGNAPISPGQVASGAAFALLEGGDESSNNISVQHPREQNDAVFGNPVDGEQPANPLTVEPIIVVSSIPGGRYNESNERIENTPLPLEPTVTGASSALGEGGGKTSNDISIQRPREQYNAVIGNPAVDGEKSAKSPNLQSMLIESSTAGDRDSGNDERIANAPLSSEPTTTEATSALGEGGDESSTRVSDQLQINTDASERENIGEPRLVSTRSVRFAPMNKVRQFDGEWAVSTLLQRKEGHAALRNCAGKPPRRRKRVRVRYSLSKKSQDSSLSNVASPTRPLYNDIVPLSHQPVKKKPIQIALLHSHSHTQLLHQAMGYIHQDRDVLLESLLKWCGILHGATPGGSLSSFLTVEMPKMGTHKLLEKFHDADYLDLLYFPPKKSLLSSTRENGDNPNQDCDESMNDSHDSDCNDASNTFEIGVQSKVFGDSTCIESFEKQTSLPYEESHLALPSDEVLSKYGLEDDCPFPTTFQAHALLWKYCLAISGASWLAASLLTADESKIQTDVAIHWGGGRHHAHANKAGGFCYVSDVVLAIHRLLHGHDGRIDVGMLEDDENANAISVQRNLSLRRILYVDIDIHHADAVQAAFYSTDRVLTASFHRHSPGFFPASSGSSAEKGEVRTCGFGYNLNVPLPAGIGDVQFIQIYRKTLFGLVKAYDPHAIVLCVGADGLDGDELVSGSLGGDDATGEGWTLSPEGLAECVRIAAALCAGSGEDDVCVSPTKKQEEKQLAASAMDSSNENDSDKKPKQGNRRKLLILGGGGYTPAQTARTHLLCTAAACEGARPGMLWSELPRDIPSHDHFPRYGPMFELVSEQKKTEIFASYSSSKTKISTVKESYGDGIEAGHEATASDRQVLREAYRTIELATLYIDRQREKKTPQRSNFCFDAAMDSDEKMLDGSQSRKKNIKSRGGRRRKRKKIETDAPQQKTTVL